MSFTLLRDAIVSVLQEKADTASSRAINTHPSGHASTDSYAMSQVDALAEARACLTAIQIVNIECNKLLHPEEGGEKNAEVKQARSKEPIY